MLDLMTKLLADESGQGLVEYALILALIAVVVAASVAAFGEDLNVLYGRIAGCVSDAAAGTACTP